MAGKKKDPFDLSVDIPKFDFTGDLGKPKKKGKQVEDLSLLSGIPEITKEFRQTISDTKRDASMIRQDASQIRNDLTPAARAIRKTGQSLGKRMKNRLGKKNQRFQVIFTRNGLTLNMIFGSAEAAEKFRRRKLSDPRVTRVSRVNAIN